MRYVTVKVKRDTQTTSSSLVAPWEVPILEYLFEEGNVSVDKDGDVVATGTFPEAGAEYGRLMKVYGSDPQSGIPHIVSVYGEGRRGLSALADAIAEAQTSEKASAKATPPKARGKVGYDPLMT